MPSRDISYCSNAKCPLRKECYRYTAKDKPWQSFAPFAPDADGYCDGFMRVVREKKRSRGSVSGQFNRKGEKMARKPKPPKRGTKKCK
jgi:hypothetical protein